MEQPAPSPAAQAGQPDPAVRRLLRRVGRSLNGNAAVRVAKNLRNAVVDRGFQRVGRDAGRRLANELAARKVRHAVFTIAFNSPWVVDLLTRAWARHQPDLALVVIDNSSDHAARAAHADLCRDRGLAHLPLPRNPEWNPNRSHGIALNWTWFNVIRRVDLEFVGFLDHDCIPVAACDIGRRMRDLDLYGLHVASLSRPAAFNVWPGYCFLRPAAAVGRTIDFKHRIEYGLDTGGGNWRGFYARLGPERVGRAIGRRVRPDLGDGLPTEECGLLDEAFLHLEGASYRGLFRDPVLRRRLADAIVERRLVFGDAGPPAPALGS